MPQSANFSVQNALKLTYKHPEIPKKIFRLAIARHKGEKRGGREGREGRGGGREGKEEGGRPRPPSFLTDRRPCFVFMVMRLCSFSVTVTGT
jgi:hypothetical protein